jgi:hypothetical protein
MKKRNEQEQTLDLREASDILENVFRECGRRPNSVPMEALASYAVYRKERFELQRGFVATLLVLFFLLPFLFIDSKYTVRVEAAGERKLPVYVIEVDSPLPVFRVTANVRGQDLPVYEAGAKTYTVEPTRNGQMRIDVALVNRQNTTDTVEVTGVDNHGPELVSSQVAGGEVRLYVRDDGVGMDPSQAYGETPDGSRIEPLRADEDQGLVVFAYPSTDLDVYVPDHIGNVLHLAMKHK